MRIVFITVSYIKTDFQKTLLKHNLESIARFYPSATRVLLNDNPSQIFDPNEFGEGVCIESTQYPQSGEVNAYVWSAIHADEYDRFVFLHDSTALIGQLPMDLGQYHFRPIWYATPFHTATGMLELDVQDTMSSLEINGKPGLQFYQELIRKNLYVVFGGMAVWDSTFATFVKSKTNLIQVAGLFNTRRLRCLFERVVYCMFKECHPTHKLNDFPKVSFCGDIFKHKAPFTNTSLDPKMANNPFVLKVWQGR